MALPLDVGLHRRIASRIRIVADEKAIPVSHIPDRAGVTRSHFYEVLGGRKSPTVSWLAKVATALDVDVVEFFSKGTSRPERSGKGKRR